jgi:hypothetical protein
VTTPRVALLMFASAFVYGQGTPSRSPSQALKVTVCEVTQSPEKFLGKRISFHAEVISDGIERTVLVDDTASCERGMTPLSIEGDARSKKAIAQLTNAIFRGHPGTIDKSIRGDFVGLFALVPPQTVGLSPHFKQVGVLKLESLSSLEVVAKPFPSH